MYVSVHSNIVFVEGKLPDAVIVGPIDVHIGATTFNAQLKSLDDVKDLMVKEAEKLGANAIVEFKYGQKSPGFLGSLLNLDDVNWYGKGFAAKLPSAKYQELLKPNQD